MSGSDGARRSLTWNVSAVFVAVVVVSVLTVGSFGYLAARRMLQSEVDARLRGVQNARVAAIEDGLLDYRGQLSSIAADPAVAAAVSRFEEAFVELGSTTRLTAEQDRELDDRYEAALGSDRIEALRAAGLDIPSAEALIPDDPAARYLQYHYLPPGPDDPRDAVVDPGDGSLYSSVHRELHPFLRDAAVAAHLDDLMIVSLESGRIVYAVEKSSDLGASVVDSPYGQGALRDVLVDQLQRVPAGETVLVDFSPYLGNAGAPTMFAATAVRDGQELVGALVGEVDIEELNGLMTAHRRWRSSGLGDTGESYVVGGDGRLRSDSRLWLESPDDYLDQVDPELAAAVTATGSTVLLQPADTDAVEAARRGGLVTGRFDNYLGEPTLTVAGGIGAGDLDWIVVADLGAREADDSLNTFLWRMLIAAAVLLPIAVGAAILLARRVLAPVPALESASAAVAAGDLDPPVDDRSADELGDLGRELRRFASDLRHEEEALAEEEARVDELLLAALPPRAVDPVRSGQVNLSDVVDTVTVVVVTIQTGAGVDPELDQVSDLVEALHALAAERGLEQVNSGTDRHVFVAGLERDDHMELDAARFALDACDLVRRSAVEGEFDLDTHAVVASGRVAMGVVSGELLSFSMWGEPARIALELDALAQPGEVLVAEAVSDLLGERAVTRPMEVSVPVGEGIDAVVLTRLTS